MCILFYNTFEINKSLFPYVGPIRPLINIHNFDLNLYKSSLALCGVRQILGNTVVIKGWLHNCSQIPLL